MNNSWTKNVSIFIATQALSLFGSSLVQFAITLHITLSTNSGVATMNIILCSFLPALLLSPFAGVWADRYNKKLLIVLSDGFIALCTLVVAILFLLGYNNSLILYVAAIIRSLGSAVQQPSIGAILPTLVPKEQLTRVNGVNGSIQSLISLISPMLGAGLLMLMGIEYVFFIDVITAAIAIVILLSFLRTPEDEKSKEVLEPPNYYQELMSGFSYIGQRKFLVYLFIFVGLFCFFAGPVAFLTPLQTARTYGADEWRIGAIDVVFSVGMLLGGLLLSVWSGFKNRIHTIAVSSVAMGITTLIMGLAPRFSFYLAAMGLCGFFMPLYNTPGIVMLQEQVDPEYMGRVFSIMAMINMTVMPLGMLIFGPVSDLIPIEWLLIATGIGFALIAVVMLNNSVLLKAGKPPTMESTL